jgi:Flp pilus assembly protein TadD
MLKLARRYPDVAAVQAQLGTLHLIRNDLPAAREAFGRALSADANQLEALTGLVEADLRDKRSASARARVGAALARREDSPKLLVLAGKTAAATGDLPEAETYFRRAIEMDPSTLEAYSMLGRMFVAQKRLTDAMREFEAAAARRPTSVSAQTMVAMLLEVQGRRAEARKRYLRILEIDPRAAVAANNLAWQMAEAGENLDLALQYSQTAKAALPDRPEINDTLGWIYYKKGLTSLAIGSLRESVEKAPQNPLFHYHLGMAYAKHGDTRSARRALEQALAMSGSFPGADEARRALGELKS